MLASLLNWLEHDNVKLLNTDIFKVMAGLFISNNLLQEYLLSEKSSMSLDDFIQCLQSNNYFEQSSEGNRSHCYRSKDYRKQIKTDGVIVKNDFLSNYFKQLPVNNHFIPSEKI